MKIVVAMICTLSSAHWQQASQFSALRRFESIWVDCDKCAYQYNNNNNNNEEKNNNNNNHNNNDDDNDTNKIKK